MPINTKDNIRVKAIIKLKLFLLQNKSRLFWFFSVLISIAFANLICQFFLRFMLNSWFRILIITPLVILAFVPLVHKLIKNLDIESRGRILLFTALSLLVAGIFYIAQPAKITGNLLLLNFSSLILYRGSRLINIISFIISISFVFLILLNSINKKMKGKLLWNIIVTLFFTVLLLIGLNIYKDYGISSDEPNERINGLVSAQYFADFIEESLPDMDPYLPKLSTYRYRYYGVAYQFPMAIIEQNAMLRGESIWFFRHLANFLFFYSGVLAFFHLTSDFFNDGRYGLIGVVFLVLSPRIFAHAFFNPKDSAFLAAFIIALYFTMRFWKQNSYRNGFLAGLSIAYASNVRIIAIALMILSLGLFLIDLIFKSKAVSWKPFALLSFSFLVFWYLLWPAAWQNPIEYLQQTILLFSDYVYWDFKVIYLGEYIRGADVPWHYLPVWMGITIPLSYIALFFVGTGIILKQSIEQKLNLFTQHEYRTKLIFLSLVLVPPVIAILRHSTLYNGWRHFHFIYPSFILIALIGAQSLIKNCILITKSHLNMIILGVFILVTSINATLTALWMFKYHPHQNVYFNPIGQLLGKENFERDYWRVSFKQGLEYLLRVDSDENILVCTEEQFQDPTFLMILPEESRSRISLIYDKTYYDLCDYALNTYRAPGRPICDKEMQSITIDGLPILSIYNCK